MKKYEYAVLCFILLLLTVSLLVDCRNQRKSQPSATVTFVDNISGTFSASVYAGTSTTTAELLRKQVADKPVKKMTEKNLKIQRKEIGLKTTAQ